MKRISHRYASLALIGIWIAGVGLIGSALSQPGPGGGPGGPGGGPGAPGPGGGGPGGGGPGGGGAGQPSPIVTLRLCNKTTTAEVIFIATVSTAGQQFRAQGWTQVTRGQCVDVGKFERPKVWWHARSPAGETWGRAAVDVCVNLNGAFQYAWDGNNRPCEANETAVAFKEEPFDPAYNLNIQNLND